MADNSEIIRSFLVSVGVTSDEKGLKRFNDTIKRVSATVFEFAKAMGAAALAVSAGVVKISGEFEELYYASQRLRSSVDNIKAFSFGVSQMGGDAKSARASLEAFSSFMRSNPMGEGFVRGLGVETRDAAGNAREYADVLRDLGGELRKMPYWAAKQRANLLGIDENTLQALLRGTDLWSDRYRKLVADSGVNMDQMSKDMTNLMQSFRLIRAELEIYLYKALSKVNPELLRLSVMLAAVGGALALIAVFVSPVAAAVVALGAAIALLVDDFTGWREGADSLINWDRWSYEIDQAMNAFKALGKGLADIGRLLAPIGQLFLDVFGPAIGKVVHDFIQFIVWDINLLGEALQSIAALLRGDWRGAWEHAKAAMAGPKGGESLAARATATAPPVAANANAPRLINWGGRGGAAPPRQATPAARGAQSDAISYFMRQGWTREQAVGIVANLQAESKLDPAASGDSALAYGIAQWHPDRQADFKRWAGKDIRDANVAEQLAFVNYELSRGSRRAAGQALRGAGSAREAAEIVSSRYEAPRDKFGEMARRGAAAEVMLAGAPLGQEGGGRTVTINADTKIKIEGSGDPRETARAVGDTLDRKNSDLVRNTRAAVR